MNDEEKIRYLHARIEALEEELQTAKRLTWMGIQTDAWAHSISGAAFTIRINVDLIRHHLTGYPAPQEINKCLERIEVMAQEFADAPAAPPRAADLPNLFVNDFLSKYLHRLEHRYKHEMIGLQIKSEFPSESYIKASPDWLRRCFDIIIDNAVAAMRGSPTKILTLSTHLVGETVEIRIRDTGRGIPDRIRPSLFRQVIEGDDKQGQLGAGLLIARTIIQAYDGEIRLAESGENGTTFVISLPRMKP